MNDYENLSEDGQRRVREFIAKVYKQEQNQRRAQAVMDNFAKVFKELTVEVGEAYITASLDDAWVALTYRGPPYVARTGVGEHIDMREEGATPEEVLNKINASLYRAAQVRCLMQKGDFDGPRD